MKASLTLRDIGEERTSALKAEAAVRGTSVSALVREWIDAGLVRSRAESARVEWIQAAQAWRADEARHLERCGPTLGQFRKSRPTER
jgi:plasmid stability protein